MLNDRLLMLGLSSYEIWRLQGWRTADAGTIQRRDRKTSGNRCPGLLRIAKYSDNYPRTAGILPAVSGASRSRPACGQDAHATAGETPTLR